MGTRFAVMDGGDASGIEDFASIDRGIDQPVIAAFHPTLDVAFEIGEAVSKDRTAISCSVSTEIDEAIFTWGKGFEELLHDGKMFALFENIQDKFSIFVHQGFDRAFFGNGDS
jgi:hypothetical protein